MQNNKFRAKKNLAEKFNPLTLSQQLIQILTEAILDGTLQGGEQLVEMELQKQFGVSRAPLREAFRELEKTGYIVILPRRGAFVKKLTVQDADEVYPPRILLEGLAARYALTRMTPEEITALEEAFAGMEKAAEADDYHLYREYHEVYHDIYLEASKNDTLLDLVKRLRATTVWHRFYFNFHEREYETSLKVHKNIIRMFKDPKTTEDQIDEAVKGHIQIGYEAFRDFLMNINETT